MRRVIAISGLMMYVAGVAGCHTGSLNYNITYEQMRIPAMHSDVAVNLRWVAVANEVPHFFYIDLDIDGGAARIGPIAFEPTDRRSGEVGVTVRDGKSVVFSGDVPRILLARSRMMQWGAMSESEWLESQPAQSWPATQPTSSAPVQ